MNHHEKPDRRARLARAIAAALMACSGAAIAAPAAAPQAQTINAESGTQSLNQQWRIANDATVEVHNVRGSVTISAGPAESASLTGDLGAGSRLVISGDAQRLDLRVDSNRDGSWFGNHGPRTDSHLDLKVPANVSLRLELVSADSRITGIDGKSLEVECVSGKAVIESGAPAIDVECVSGDVDLRVTKVTPDSRLHAQTVSGDIEANGVGGRVKLETVSGNGRANGREVQEFEGGSVSGDIELHAALAAHGRFKASTMSGDIRAQLQPDISARFEAETFSGDIESDFGTVKRPEFGPGSSLDAHVGDGDAEVSVETFSGSISLRKQH